MCFGAFARASDIAALEAQANSELEAKDPEAAKLFRQANEVRMTDAARASALYSEVLARVPLFDHALRRKCAAEVRLGHVTDGLKLCRQAIAVRRNAENLSGIALAIVLQHGEISAMHRTEAIAAADEAARLGPRETYVHTARCHVAMRFSDWAKVKESLAQLDSLAPNEAETQAIGAMLAMVEGRFKDADSRIARAEALGAPADMMAALRKHRAESEEAATPWLVRAASLFARAAVAWAIGLLLLAFAGYLASVVTLRKLEGDKDPTAGVSSVRSAYRVIVWIGAAYYYVSLPLVFVLVLGAAGGVTVLCLSIGIIPVKLLLILALFTLGTLWATLRSVFVRVDDTPPGMPIGAREHPRLRALLGEVAKKIGTRDLDEVRLTVGTDLAVTERGRSLSGNGNRTLILGVGLLDGLRVRELKSLLAHEFGHFRNEDTAGGGLAIRVRRTILMMAVHLARSGAASWWNPAWLFVTGYHKLFLRITQGASRLQEVLADRWAVNAYGSKAFRRGLRHVIRRSIAFDEHVERSVSDATDLRRGWANLYQYRPSKPVDDEDVAEKLQEQLETAASPYDSHPAPADRLAAAKELAAEGEPFADGDEDEAWSLFDDRESLERKMTEEVRVVLGARGIVVDDEEQDEDDD